MRLIDADKLPLNKIDDANYGSNYIRIAPTVEVIPKSDYENRLKADIVAMLTELQLEIEELDTPNNGSAYMDCAEIIQQRIDKLKKNMNK